MTVNQLKTVLQDRITTYWSGATVVWGATDNVKPPSPLVILRLGTVNRVAQPIQQNINGIVFSTYPSETSLQVDLFTRGNKVEVGDDEYYENTATNDMLDFVNFLDSLSTVEWSNRNDISITLLNGIQDLSEVINDSQWQYRAMVELRISFTGWSAEYNGVLNEDSIIFGEDGIPAGVDTSKWKQTASGGGTEELAKAATSSFDKIEPQYDYE